MSFPGHRAADAVITVRQDNSRRAVEIRDLNPPAEEALGYALPAVSGLPLAALLPERIRTLLEEYIEFQEDGNDVGAVLSKVQSFCLLHRDGKELRYRLKVLRGEPENGCACFHLVLQSRAGERQGEAVRALLREHFRGHEVLEERTGLPDRPSVIKDISFVRHYVNKEMLHCCIAVVGLDQYAALKSHNGEDNAVGALLHVGSLARQNLRGDDVTGCIGESSLALILLGTSPESARMVLNRLRWLIAANPASIEGQSAPVTVSIAFARISGDGEDRDLLSRLEEKMAVIRAQPGNSLAEVTE